MKTALLVIDMQNICMGKNHAKIFQYDQIGLLKRINQRISEFEPKNVYYIKNFFKSFCTLSSIWRNGRNRTSRGIKYCIKPDI